MTTADALTLQIKIHQTRLDGDVAELRNALGGMQRFLAGLDVEGLDVGELLRVADSLRGDAERVERLYLRTRGSRHVLGTLREIER